MGERDEERTRTMEEEVRRVVDAAEERGIHLRVIGGVAVKLHCPSAEHRSMARTYGDVDFIGYRKQRTEVSRLMEDLGYEPNRQFNILQGHRRLLFDHPDLGYDADVMLDVFVMCHELNFVDRLEVDEYTVPIEELLLSKMQVIELNEKDIKDSFAMLVDHDIAEVNDREIIDSRFIAKLCGDDWGWYKTLTMNIDKITDLAPDFLDEKEREVVVDRLGRLRRIIEEAPKSMKWKMRARVGEKKRWYELPEDVVTHKH
ncbi:MAG: nucleotidyltransferase family protein [Promethearchaeota archaeon]